MSIAVIDDDEDILELYSDYLESMGHRDIKLYQDSKPFTDTAFVEQVVAENDAIICDIRMPFIDGKDIMDKVIDARIKLSKNTVFIFISGIPKDYYPCTSGGWGALVKADDILGKPVTFDEFKRVLELHSVYPPLDSSNFEDAQ